MGRKTDFVQARFLLINTGSKYTKIKETDRQTEEEQERQEEQEQEEQEQE